VDSFAAGNLVNNYSMDRVIVTNRTTGFHSDLQTQAKAGVIYPLKKAVG
jgi:hypothetical protein